MSNSYIIKAAWKFQKLGAILITNMTHKNPLRFHRCKISNTENSEPHKEATRTMTDAGMLVLLRRRLRNAVTFCASEIVWTPKTTEKRHRKQRLICDRK
jgi:hypothetical protein